MTIQGTNFSFDGTTINFFGWQGYRTSTGTWVFGFEKGDTPNIEDDPSPQLQGIQQLIAQDEADGNGHRVAMVLVRARTARSLFLEGLIVPAHLQNAQEHDGVVDIPMVTVTHTRVLTVRVLEDLRGNIATADSNGEII